MTEIREPSAHVEWIARSPAPDIPIPEVAVDAFALRRAGDLADKPALIDGPTGRTLSYGELARQVDRVAAGLQRRGLAKGQVVGLCSPNCPEYAIAFLGVARAGGVTTTISPLATSGELAWQLRDAQAHFLVADPAVLEKAREAARQAPSVREVFVIGQGAGATPFDALLVEAAGPEEVGIAPREDLVALLYSSGTTGLPKGVMLTHSNLVAEVAQLDGLLPLAEADTALAFLPFFHCYGLGVILLPAVRTGATIVTMPRFDVEGFLALVQRHRVSLGFLVPPVVLALAKSPLVDRYDLSSLRVAYSGGAPLDDGLAAACTARLGATVIQAYGMTEASGATHCTPAGKNKPGSVGPGCRNTETKVVDLASGAALGPGQPGEICIRGPQVMKGYLNHPEATANAVDPGGWLHTGDVGYADDEGYVFIVDRVKEMIKYKAYQVAPAELEALLVSHPAVADAAVIGIPDAEAGEAPKAFVVRRGDVSQEELLGYVAARVAPYKKVRRVEFIEAIPKSPSGKILRRVLVERERA
jgi:acyl-CoA synthetase (AMP-forming)/AMP-acid ligase II